MGENSLIFFVYLIQKVSYICCNTDKRSSNYCWYLFVEQNQIMLNCSRKDRMLLIGWEPIFPFFLPYAFDSLNYSIFEVQILTLSYKVWYVCGTVSLWPFTLGIKLEFVSDVCRKFLKAAGLGFGVRFSPQTQTVAFTSCVALGICPECWASLPSVKWGYPPCSTGL